MQEEEILNKLIDAIQTLKIPDNDGSGVLLTIKEASTYLRCSTVSFLKIRKEANIQPVYIGKKPFFQKSVLDDYINRNNKNLKSPKEIFELLNIPRIVLLQLEIDRKIKAHLIGENVKYDLVQVYMAIQETKREVSNE